MVNFGKKWAKITLFLTEKQLSLITFYSSATLKKVYFLKLCLNMADSVLIQFDRFQKHISHTVSAQIEQRRSINFYGFQAAYYGHF